MPKNADEGNTDVRNIKYVLRLYVTGMTPRAQDAIRNIKKICEEELQGRYELEVVDIYQQPELAKKEQDPGGSHAHQGTSPSLAEAGR